MQKVYYPEKLKTESEKLKERFGSGTSRRMMSRDNLRELIENIVNHDSADLDFFKLVLKKYQIEAIAKYIQKNAYGVDISNLLKLIVIMNDFKYFDIIYKNWQKEIDIPFKDENIIMLTEYYGSEIDKMYHILPNQLKFWMCNKDVADSMGKTLFDNCNSKSDFELIAKKAHIDKNTMLYNCIEQNFYCYCSERAFTDTGDIELCYLIEKLVNEKAYRIIYHFLDVVSPNHYDKFERLATHAKDLIGEINSLKYDATVGKQSEHIRESYKALLNMYWMLRLFGQDDRSKFWKRYISDFTVQYYSNHDMLLMDFGMHYITEFKTVGVIYIFEKDYFKNIYLRNISTERTNLLKSKMRSDDKHIFMQEHRGNWQRKVMIAINKYNVTTRNR